MSTLLVTDLRLPVMRRSGNYKPCVWNDDFVQTMATDYTVLLCHSICFDICYDAIELFVLHASHAN